MDNRLIGGQANIAADVSSIGDKNRLLTESISLSVAFDETERGNGYNFNTGAITLTGNGTTSAVFYMKNNESKDIILPKLFFIIGNSTGGAGDIDVTVVRNPTGGTIVSNAVATDINSNRNYGSNQTLTADAYKGAEGDTLTGGNDSIFTILGSDAQREVIDVGGIVLTKGSSIGVTVKTQAGNSSVRVAIAAEVYRVTLPV